MALNVVFHGNSITAGQGATIAFPALVSTALSITGIVRGYGAYTTNYSPRGAGVLYPNFDAHVHASYSAGNTNIVVFQESTNALYYGQTVAQEIADLIQYATYARSKGWLVAICNVMQRGVTGEPPTIAEWRVRAAEINAWIASNWRTHFDGFADIANCSPYASTPFIGNGNVAFFADSAHPNNAGHALIAPVVTASVQRAALMAGVRARVTSTVIQTIYEGGIIPCTYQLVDGVFTVVSTPNRVQAYG